VRVFSLVAAAARPHCDGCVFQDTKHGRSGDFRLLRNFPRTETFDVESDDAIGTPSRDPLPLVSPDHCRLWRERVRFKGVGLGVTEDNHEFI
jgi:hypothetical protein